MKTPATITTPARLLLARLDAVADLWNRDIESPEAVHDLRVAIRRLRSALQAFRLELPPDARHSAQDALRRAQKRLGAVRDWDVAIEQSKRDDDPRLDRKLLQMAATRRARALSQARKFLKAAPWMDDLRSAARDIPDTTDLKVIAEVELDERSARVCRDLDAYNSREGLHRLRISIKKLRYAIELFDGVLKTKRLRTDLRLLKRLQDQLGELHDPQSISDMLERGEAGARDDLPRRLIEDLDDLSRSVGQWDRR